MTEMTISTILQSALYNVKRAVPIQILTFVLIDLLGEGRVTIGLRVEPVATQNVQVKPFS